MTNRQLAKLGSTKDPVAQAVRAARAREEGAMHTPTWDVTEAGEIVIEVNPGKWAIAFTPGRNVSSALTLDFAKQAASAPTLAADNARLRAALSGLMSWTMRDGTPCGCPAGREESEPRKRMPTTHSTACEDARAALAQEGT